MGTTTDNINPKPCQAVGCAEQHGTSELIVEPDGVKINVRLCANHRRELAQAREKKPS